VWKARTSIRAFPFEASSSLSREPPIPQSTGNPIVTAFARGPAAVP
jgi:hypothetical protein